MFIEKTTPFFEFRRNDMFIDHGCIQAFEFRRNDMFIFLCRSCGTQMEKDNIFLQTFRTASAVDVIY